MSIAAKLLDWMLAPLLFLWFASVALTNFAAIDTVDTPFDHRLEDIARTLAAEMEYSGSGEPRLSLSRQAELLLAADRHDETYFAVRTAAGRVLVGNNDIPPGPGARTPGLVTFHTGIVGGGVARIATLPVARLGDSEAFDAMVQVAETLNKRHDLSGDIHNHVIFPQLLVIVGAMILVWYGLQYVTAPMSRLSSDLDRRESNDLAPFDPGEMPREIRPLIDGLNHLMERLRRTIAAEQRFVANAAHQLRTPIAGIRAQTELARRTRDPADLARILEQLSAGSERVTHLANQLLSLARIGSGAVGLRLVRLEPDVWLPNVIEPFVPRAVARGIDLGFEPAAPGIAISADPTLFGELVSNLIDNALRYTLERGSVTVSTRYDEGMVIEVEDSGPGIPEDEREAAFAPFHRLPGRESVDELPGSGLGLAIVREIAEAHGAGVAIDRSPRHGGARVSVRIQLAAPASRSSNGLPKRA